MSARALSVSVSVVALLVASAALSAEPRQLVKDGLPKSGLSLSADGTRVAFLMDRADQIGDDVCVADVATGKMTNLTARLKEAPYTDNFFIPQLTPDGKTVVYVQGNELWSVAADGSAAPQSLTDGEGVDWILMAPRRGGVVFSSSRALSLADLEKPAPKGVAGVVMTKLCLYDLAAKKVSMLTRDWVADGEKAQLMPDGRLVTVGGYPDKQDGYSNRFITAIDDKGKRTKTSMGPVFSFEPAYLNGGSTLVVIDQVLKGDDFVYPLVTWDFATKKRGTLDITLPKGQMVSWMWSVPDFKSIVMAVGKEGEGYDIYRFDPASKTPVRLTEKKFASCYGGSITPDGKKLLFVGSLPAVKGEEVWVLDL